MALWRSLGRRLCRFHFARPNSKACVSRSDRAATRLARPAAVRPPLIGAGQVFVIPERPSPRKAHPHHESNEESPESQWLFGAVWGAQPQRTPRGKRYKANVLTQKCTLPHRRLRSPRPLRSLSGSPERNAQSRSELTKFDNHIDDPRTREWRSRPTRE